MDAESRLLSRLAAPLAPPSVASGASGAAGSIAGRISSIGVSSALSFVHASILGPCAWLSFAGGGSVPMFQWFTSIVPPTLLSFFAIRLLLLRTSWAAATVVGLCKSVAVLAGVYFYVQKNLGWAVNAVPAAVLFAQLTAKAVGGGAGAPPTAYLAIPLLILLVLLEAHFPDPVQAAVIAGSASFLAVSALSYCLYFLGIAATSPFDALSIFEAESGAPPAAAGEGAPPAAAAAGVGVAYPLLWALMTAAGVFVHLLRVQTYAHCELPTVAGTVADLAAGKGFEPAPQWAGREKRGGEEGRFEEELPLAAAQV